ncbi:hypothetical protein RFW18_16190 [Metabacillus idriensis]|uniref:hypothetical protein n=1 Tax=Metabacillus idriensis TaxID=324768 RepID=UPI00281388A2|nr:hypothetical protein [Metabacillus idriensis]MDR0139294.1 hypothetical protein [Metabacillus idriensis]
MEIKIRPEELEDFAQRIEQSRFYTGDALDLLNWESARLRFTSVARVDRALDLQEEIRHLVNRFHTLTQDAKTLIENTANGMREADEAAKSSASSGWGGFFSGLWDGAKNGLTDAWDGLVSLTEWETYEAMWDAIIHPLETLESMWNTLSEAWETKVINGDVYSRTEFFTYGVVSIGLGILGGKGIDKLGKAAKLTKVPDGTSSNPKVATVTHGMDTSFDYAKLSQGKGFAAEIDSVLGEVGLTRDEFLELQPKHHSELTQVQLEKMRKVRDAVGPVDEDTVLQKVIDLGRVDSFLSGRETTLSGCIARMDDVADVHMSDDVFYSLRLDYGDENYPTPFSPDEGYAVIRFTTDDYDKMKIPFAEELGSPNAAKPNEFIQYPQTGHGFTAAENGRIIPEFETKYRDGAVPAVGEIYEVKNGVEELVGIYVEDDRRFYSLKELQGND